MIMDKITALLGHNYGPRNGKIEPRACRYCNYYGHTRQWCKKRTADDKVRYEYEADKLLEEDRKLFEKMRDAPTVVNEPYDPTKTGQAITFDKLGMPYTIDSHCGPIVGAPGDTHHGKWTFDKDGQVIIRDSQAELAHPHPEPDHQSH